MSIKMIAASAALAVALTSGSAFAGEQFKALKGVSAEPMKSAEMADVRGMGHILAMLGRLGLTFEPGDPAYGNRGGPGTGRGLFIAGSGGSTGCGGCGNDINTIRRLHQ